MQDTILGMSSRISEMLEVLKIQCIKLAFLWYCVSKGIIKTVSKHIKLKIKARMKEKVKLLELFSFLYKHADSHSYAY